MHIYQQSVLSDKTWLIIRISQLWPRAGCSKCFSTFNLYCSQEPTDVLHCFEPKIGQPNFQEPNALCQNGTGQLNEQNLYVPNSWIIDVMFSSRVFEISKTAKTAEKQFSDVTSMLTHRYNNNNKMYKTVWIHTARVLHPRENKSKFRKISKKESR